jgi:hypothetical protein
LKPIIGLGNFLETDAEMNSELESQKSIAVLPFENFAFTLRALTKRSSQPQFYLDARDLKGNRVGVADVIYEAVESFVAKCEAEADLETKIIKFRQ